MSSILFNRGVNTQTGNPVRAEMTRLKNRIEELEHKLNVVMKTAGVEDKVKEALEVEAKAAEAKALETARSTAMSGSTISFVGGSRGGTAASVVRR